MYNLVRDDDGHWFVIPSDKQEKWEEYMREIYEFEKYETPMPDWAKPIGGSPTLVKFPSYTIG